MPWRENEQHLENDSCMQAIGSEILTGRVLYTTLTDLKACVAWIPVQNSRGLKPWPCYTSGTPMQSPWGFIPWLCLCACYTSGIPVQSPWGFIPWPSLRACYISGIPMQSPWGFIPWPSLRACYISGIPMQSPWGFIPWPCPCACYTSGIPVQSPWGFIPWPCLCACYTVESQCWAPGRSYLDPVPVHVTPVESQCRAPGVHTLTLSLCMLHSGIPVLSPWGFIPWPCPCACYTSGIPEQSPSRESQTSLSVEGSICPAGRSDTHSEPWCDSRDWTVCLNDRTLKWDQISSTLTLMLQTPKILIVHLTKPSPVTHCEIDDQ